MHKKDWKGSYLYFLALYRRPTILTFDRCLTCAARLWPSSSRVCLSYSFFCRIDICSFIIFDVGKTPDDITAFTGIDDFTDQEVTEAKAEHAWLKDVFLPKKKSQVT